MTKREHSINQSLFENNDNFIQPAIWSTKDLSVRLNRIWLTEILKILRITKNVFSESVKTKHIVDAKLIVAIKL